MASTFPLANRVLADAIAAHVFPGAIVEVGRGDGALATLTQGALTYAGAARAVDPGTVYDLASLTKVLATTPLVSGLSGVDRMRLDDAVRRFVPAWSGDDRQSVTIQDLLEHCSGLPAHREYFESMRGGPAYAQAICQERLAYAPRSQAIYSDPGFMLLGFAIEAAGESALDALFDQWRDAELGATVEIRYRPPAAWLERTAPTENSPSGDERRGAVHDENAAALGGVAGHAGLFGTAPAVGACARWWLQRTAPLSRFLQKSSVPGSSRALGWDTMLPSSSCGTRMSPAAFGHTGFTGTSVWIDPAQDLYVVFLSNRVHPTRAGKGIQSVRRALHDAVIEDLSRR